MTTVSSEARTKGRLACLRNTPRVNNPYPKNSAASRWWFEGWDAALMERMTPRETK